MTTQHCLLIGSFSFHNILLSWSYLLYVAGVRLYLNKPDKSWLHAAYWHNTTICCVWRDSLLRGCSRCCWGVLWAMWLPDNFPKTCFSTFLSALVQVFRKNKQGGSRRSFDAWPGILCGLHFCCVRHLDIWKWNFIWRSAGDIHSDPLSLQNTLNQIPGPAGALCADGVAERDSKPKWATEDSPSMRVYGWGGTS